MTLDSLRQWARRMKRDTVALWFAYRDPRAPWPAKALCVVTVAYALSPIDLIPDFIPVLGYLDDVILLPGLIWLVVRLMPPAVMDDARSQADAWIAERRARPRSIAGACAILVLWLAALAWVGWLLFGR